MKTQFFLLFLPALVFGASKNFAIEYVVDCPGEEGLPITSQFNVNNTSNIANKIIFSAQLNVAEKVPGPLEFVFEVNRCDLKGEKCEKYSSIKVSKNLTAK